MTSPSTIARFAAIQSGGSRNGPKYRAASCRPLVQSRTWPRSTTVSTRKPSHLISNDHAGSSNGAATSVASIGSMNSGIGSRRPTDAAFAGLATAGPAAGHAGCHLVVRPARLHALRMILGVPVAHGLVVATVDQQPLLATVTAEIGTDEDEASVELLALERELELAARERIGGVGHLRIRRPSAPVPHDDVARAVLAARDGALEREILQGMVL